MTNFDEIFGGVGYVINNKQLYDGDDPDHIPDPGICKGIFSTAEEGRGKNLADELRW